MKAATLVFPHQLFRKNPAAEKERRILLIEDPLFFGDEKYPLRFHKRKLVYLRAAMRSYMDRMSKGGYNIEYIEYKEMRKYRNHHFRLLNDEGVKIVHYCDTVDFMLEKRIASGSEKYSIKTVRHETPNFLNDNEFNFRYFESKKTYFLSNFYVWQRKRFNILIDNNAPRGGKWSFDAENRKRLPKSVKPPALPFGSNSSYIKEAVKYVESNFPENPGFTGGEYFPIDHKGSSEWLDDFLERRFIHYGDYQDSISESETYLFHSVISPMLNIGLLSPTEIIERVLEFAGSNSIPMNSLEGFIRQIAGWREFVRAVYLLEGVRQRTSNFWNHHNPLPDKFYNGTTGIPPIDHTISKLNKTAYNHHIERLMLLGNFMLLCGIDPDQVYNWFMEMYIDGYDWVMVPNVYGMSQFADGGLMSTKPYISSSNYVVKMSDYGGGNWREIWDALFWRFISEHRKYFAENRRTIFISKQLERMASSKLNSHIKRAESFLNSMFS